MVVLIILLWRIKMPGCQDNRVFKVDNAELLLPFKLFAVFLHELCHATACWLTCGSVVSLEVT